MRRILHVVLYVLLVGVLILLNAFYKAKTEDLTGRRSGDGPWPVRWTEHFDAEDVSGFDRLLDADALPYDFLDDPLILTDCNDERSDPPQQVTVRTGRQYLELQDRGFDATSTPELVKQGYFVQAVGPIPYLLAAQPSEHSYVSDFRFDRIEVTDLPHDFALHEMALAYIEESDVNPQELPLPRITAAAPNSIEIVGANIRQMLTLVAWGDFDGDGIEDLLIECSYRAVRGTMRVDFHAALTRLQVDGPLTCVDLEGIVFRPPDR